MWEGRLEGEHREVLGGVEADDSLVECGSSKNFPNGRYLLRTASSLNKERRVAYTLSMRKRQRTPVP
jgi:hypothetical protein